MFSEISEVQDEYQKLYKQFSKNIKLGIHEDPTTHTKVTEVIPYHASRSGDEQISLRS